MPVAPAGPLVQTAMNRPVPLVVDLDGTLLRSDLLVETAVRFLRTASIQSVPGAIGQVGLWLTRGKVALKTGLAEAAGFDPTVLPYNDDVIALIRSAREAGRPIVLATASHRVAVDRIARHLDLFDDVLATDGIVNLSGREKRDRLVATYGKAGFDYIGNAREDLPVWAAARQAIVVDAPRAVLKRASAQGNVSQVLHSRHPSLRPWIQALRLHQWIKNLLIFVPCWPATNWDPPPRYCWP